jgi:hypothetical protein
MRISRRGIISAFWICWRTRPRRTPKCVVMAGESGQGFDALLQQHLARFAPGDGVDQGYVEEMVAAAWRMRRAWAMETRLFDDAVAEQPPGDERGRMAAALGSLALRPEFALLPRYWIDTKPACISATSALCTTSSSCGKPV